MFRVVQKTGKHHPPRAPPRRALSQSSTDSPLGKLFDQEDFLVKVLGHLVDTGLHECAQVSKKWNAVCKKLAKLNVSWQKLPLVAQNFPDVTHLSSQASEIFRSIFIANSDDEIKPECFDQLVLAHLTSLTKLECLKVDILDFIFYTSVLLENYIKQLDHLRSLTIQGLWLDGAGEYFYSHLRYLTNLTLLDLSLKNVRSTTTAPFTELQKIEHLCVPNLLVNNKRELMFPSLTKLTHLEIGDVHPQGCDFDRKLLEVCVRHFMISLNLFV